MGGAWRHPDRRPLSTARRVFCRVGQKEYGIPLLVKILGEFGFRGTYFVETLSTRCLGEAEIRAVFDFLLQEGQDVQLHIHPTFRFYAEWQEARTNGAAYEIPAPSDLIGHFAEERQMELLAEAADYFKRFAGYGPLAFRAGCYAGSRTTMRCLCRLGVKVDSSYNPSYHPELSFPKDMMVPNLVQQMEGVWEIPVTVARTRLPEGYQGFKFADCSALSFSEIRTMLDAAVASKLQHFVMVFHSFSAVKSRDETYRDMRPNRIVIRRLRKVFQFLAENPGRFHVETLGQVSRDLVSLEESKTQPVVAKLNLGASALRKAVQVWNNFFWT